MADSDNILSILAGLQQAPAAAPTNVLQSVAPQALPGDTTQPYYPANPAPVAAPAAPPPVQEAPQRRRSLLDTIGRISDVLAKVGGADALYQPTLDAREDRTLKLGDHARQVTSDDLKIATDKFDLGDKQNLRLGQAARGAKAILTANPQADPTAVWGAIAQQMGLPPEQAQAVGQKIAANPAELDGIIAASTDPKYDQAKYGGQVVYGKDANGNLVAFQPGLGNEPGRNVLPDGITPIDPEKFVDTGGAQVGYGSRSGNPMRILPKTVRPDTVANNQQSDTNNRRTTGTAVTIAGMPARAQAPKAGGGGTADMGVANQLLDNIQAGFDNLHRLGSLPGDNNSAAGSVLGAIGRTGIGQAIGEQAGNSSAQARVAIEKDINSLQSEMIKSLPASATRTKFEQEIQRRRMPDPARMSYATAQQVIGDLRRQFAQAQKDAATEIAGKQTPVRRPAAKANGGWSIVGVK